MRRHSKARIKKERKVQDGSQVRAEKTTFILNYNRGNGIKDRVRILLDSSVVTELLLETTRSDGNYRTKIIKFHAEMKVSEAEKARATTSSNHS
jgi:hypothetical protein